LQYLALLVTPDPHIMHTWSFSSSVSRYSKNFVPHVTQTLSCGLTREPQTRHLVSSSVLPLDFRLREQCRHFSIPVGILFPQPWQLFAALTNRETPSRDDH
jgi:hypothetical protein